MLDDEDEQLTLAIRKDSSWMNLTCGDYSRADHGWSPLRRAGRLACIGLGSGLNAADEPRNVDVVGLRVTKVLAQA